MTFIYQHTHRETEYITFCVSGYRSATAVSLLRREGYKARDIYGGFAAVSVYEPELTTTGQVSQVRTVGQ